jgi:rhamnose transport system ATP-binding protein
MVGRELSQLYPKLLAEIGGTVLRIEHLTREGVFMDVSFEVRRGEIVALAGLVGAGRSEVARAIFGIDTPDAGHVEVDGARLKRGSPAAAMRAGIGLVPEDRRQQGLVMELSIERNIGLTRLQVLRNRLGIIGAGSEAKLASDWATKLQLRFHRLSDPVGFLSGGNQQKVVISKSLVQGPNLIIFDEPTRGVDVGAKGEIYARIRELAAQGVGILVASSEMPELIGLCDRIVVLRGGRTVAEFPAGAAEDDILAVAESNEDDSDE